jgi:hypothetical protein
VARRSWHIACTITCIDGIDAMLTRQLLGLVTFATFAASVSAQTLYRCQDGARVTYSDRACIAGAARQLPADAGPPIAEQAAAVVRLKQDIADFDVRWAARVAAAQSASAVARKGAGAKLGGGTVGDTDGRCEPGAVASTTPVGAGPGRLIQANAARRD